MRKCQGSGRVKNRCGFVDLIGPLLAESGRGGGVVWDALRIAARYENMIVRESICVISCSARSMSLA